MYETILSNMPDCAYVFDRHHRLTYANEALLAAWNLSPQEALGRTWLELGYAPDQARMHDREIEAALSSGEPVRGVGLFAGLESGRIYDYVFVPVLGDDGEVECVAGTARDVTEAQRAAGELRRADRRKEDFIALLAHELRNPLSPVMNGLQIMKLASDDRETIAEVRDMMQRQLSHLIRLIDDLLDVSRITRNKLRLQRSRVPLADVIADSVDAVKPLMSAKQHELSVELPSTPVVLFADATRLSQVFANLLGNSAKYTAPHGRIRLTAREAEGRVEIVVRDSGAGIAERELTTIFDMFAQAERSGAVHNEGLGVGLALVKGLVEMHGGTIDAHSDGVDEGSIFAVTLPLLDEREAGIRRPERLEPPCGALPAAAAGPRRVLVVDDNEDLAATTARMLNLLGHEVYTACDGVECLQVAERYRPDIVFMDIELPRLDGLEATRRLREKAWGRGCAIVALTGWGQERDRAESERAGCDGHLVKPVRLQDLEMLLRELAAPGRRAAAGA